MKCHIFLSERRIHAVRERERERERERLCFCTQMIIKMTLRAALHLMLTMLASIVCPCLTFAKRQ